MEDFDRELPRYVDGSSSSGCALDRHVKLPVKQKGFWVYHGAEAIPIFGVVKRRIEMAVYCLSSSKVFVSSKGMFDPDGCCY